MPNFHPCENTLAEFAAGSLDFAHSLSVSAHLDYCPECRAKVRRLVILGGELAFSHAQPAAVEKGSFQSLMGKIRDSEAQQNTVSNTASGGFETSQCLERDAVNCDLKAEPPSWAKDLPLVLQKLIPRNEEVNWTIASPSLREARLKTGQNEHQVCLHRIKRGGKVPAHDHRGREVTLVLHGAFSDDQGTYRQGDYVVKEAGEIHRPIATQDVDCLCLSVLDAPVKLTGIFTRMLNPFISVQPG